MPLFVPARAKRAHVALSVATATPSSAVRCRAKIPVLREQFRRAGGRLTERACVMMPRVPSRATTWTAILTTAEPAVAARVGCVLAHVKQIPTTSAVVEMPTVTTVRPRVPSSGMANATQIFLVWVRSFAEWSHVPLLGCGIRLAPRLRRRITTPDSTTAPV